MTYNKALIPTVIFAALSLTAASADAGQRRGGGGRESRSYRGGSVYRGGGGVRVAPRVYSRGYIGGPRFYRPYYSFRPRFTIGFGIWAGYPVTYPYYYDYPYGYAYPAAPYPYGYPPAQYGYPSASQPYNYPPSNYPPSNYPASNYPPSRSEAGNTAPDNYPPQARGGASIGVQPGSQQRNSGGLSFEITPGTAEVFADGAYVGNVAMFDPASEPLGLTPGRHHIEIRADGYQTMAFDADVTAGQVIPYQGTLQAAQR